MNKKTSSKNPTEKKEYSSFKIPSRVLPKIPNRKTAAYIGGNYGKGDCPPGHVLATQKVVLSILLSSADQGAEDRGGNQINGQNRIVEEGKTHSRNGIWKGSILKAGVRQASHLAKPTDEAWERRPLSR